MCHTQVVERCINVVTEASVAVCGSLPEMYLCEQGSGLGKLCLSSVPNFSIAVALKSTQCLFNE